MNFVDKYGNTIEWMNYLPGDANACMEGLNHIQAGLTNEKENGILATGWGQKDDFESDLSFKSQISTQ